MGKIILIVLMTGSGKTWATVTEVPTMELCERKADGLRSSFESNGVKYPEAIFTCVSK